MMDSRTISFFAAAAILIVVRIAMSVADRRHRSLFEAPAAEPRWAHEADSGCGYYAARRRI
jgi:hypothetical protein